MGKNFYEGGASQFVQFLNEGKDVLHDVIHFMPRRMTSKSKSPFNIMQDTPKRWPRSLTPSRRAGRYA